MKNKKEDIEEILKRPGEKTDFVPTNFGAMKVNYKNYIFSHQYSRNRIARYRCDSFDKLKCPAAIIVKGSITYPCNQIEHDHPPHKKNS